MKRTVFGMKSKAIILSLAYHFPKKTSLSAFGDSATQHKRVFYANLLTSCKLNSYLTDVDEQAEEIFSRLVIDLAEKENITEKLKAENSMLWVQHMNSIRNRATEVVNADLIYA